MKVSNMLKKRNFCALVLICALFSAMPGLGQTETAEITETKIEVELGFGTGIDRETRSLTGENTVFPAGVERIFCRMKIVGIEAPATVTHAWYRDGKTMAEVGLNVGSSHWRTWSSKRLLPDWTGFWEVKVLDQEGKVLASSSFEVQ